MTTPLPARPSLDWLRKRAKLMLKQLRKTRPSAQLAEAQLAVARAHGFSSWRALKATVDATAAPPSEELVADFLRLVRTGDTGAVRGALAQHPELVNATGPHPFWGGRPQPLHLAIESGRRPMFDLLLGAGADPNGSNEGYMHWSPLMLASSGRKRGMYQALIRKGARVSLVEALMKGDDRMVLRLLRPGASALPRVVPNEGSLLMFARTPRAIDRLLELGVPADTRDHWGTTPIEALSRLGRTGRPLVRRLQSRGVSAEPGVFARMGDRSALERLARQDPGVPRDPAVLMGAVDFKHHALARWLLSMGADPNARTTGQSQQTPLHAAAWNGDLAMAKLLVAAGADPALRDRQYDSTPQGWAETSVEVTSNEKCAEVAEWLAGLSGGKAEEASPEDRPAKRVVWKPIMDAAFNGDPAAVKRLLSRGADPNILSNTPHRYRPLHRAIERKKTLPKHEGHEEAVRLLLEAGADPLRRALQSKVTPLALAATDEPRFVPILLPYAGRLDLFHAAVTLDLTRVRELLESGASPQAMDLNTMTPLHYCAASAMYQLSAEHQQRQLALARALLAAGAQVNQIHAYGTHWSISPLFYAAGHHDNPLMTEFLLQAGADPADGEGIYHAADEGHTRSLEVFTRLVPPEILAAQATQGLTAQLRWGSTRGAPWLLAHGADPNALNSETGDAALHAAARSGVSSKVIELLLRHGARPELRNRDGETAREVARKTGNSMALP